MAKRRKHAKPYGPDVFPGHLANKNDKLLQSLPEEMRTLISKLPHSEKDFPFIAKLLIASGGLPASYFHDETIATAISELASHFKTTREAYHIFQTALGMNPNLFTVSNPALQAAIKSLAWDDTSTALSILWLPFKNGGDPAIIHQMFEKCKHRDYNKNEIVEAFFTRQTSPKCCRWFMECIPDIQNAILDSGLVPHQFQERLVRPSTDKMDAVWNEVGKIFIDNSSRRGRLSEFERTVLQEMPFAFGKEYYEFLEQKLGRRERIVNRDLSFEIWLHGLDTIRSYVKWTKTVEGNLDDDVVLARALGEHFRLYTTSIAHALVFLFETERSFLGHFIHYVCKPQQYHNTRSMLRKAASILKSRGMEHKTDAFCRFIIKEFEWNNSLFPFRDGYDGDYELYLPRLKQKYFS